MLTEIDAGRRGLRMPRDAGLSGSPNDAQGSESVLAAAALTYLVAVPAVLTLLHHVALARN